MTQPTQPVVILMADDDADDREMAQEAFAESRLRNDLRFVKDGIELLDYLFQRNDYAEAGVAPRPGLILLDLNMPRMDGRQALDVIKAEPKLKSIPVIILTTSKAEADILLSYDLGANSFITKPVRFQDLIKVVHSLTDYWLEIVSLPESKP